MPRTLSVKEFAARAAELVRGVAGGEAVVVTDEGRPLAVLASHDSVASLASVLDFPRWEEWLHEMREAFPEAAVKLERLRGEQPEPAEVDKSLLGFEPSLGKVGSPEGREHLANELRRLNVPVNDEELLAAIYADLLELCEEKSRLYEEDLRVMAQEKIAEAPQRLRLLAVTVQSTTGLPATAEVTLELGHGPAMRREHGDGPLDAAMKAIQRLTNLEPEVENFSVVAATRGSDALAEAVIELSLDGRRVLGRGASPNAIEAGVHAYLNALNFLVEARREA
jgi:prevent-host-death family protein